MKSKIKSAENFLKKRIFIMLFFLIISLLSMVLSILIAMHDHEQVDLINILGRQRMLSQKMAKDALRLYTLNDIFEEQIHLEPEETIIAKINMTKLDLLESRNNFQDVFFAIQKGVITLNGRDIHFEEGIKKYKTSFSSIDTTWLEFSNAVTTVLNMDKYDDNVGKALKDINEKSDILMNYSDVITGAAADYVNSVHHKKVIFTVAFCMISLSTLIILVHNIYKHLFMPLDDLYSGLSEIGFTKNSIKVRKNTSEFLKPVIEEIQNAISRVNHILDILEQLNKNNNFNEILEYIFSSFSRCLPYTYIGVSIVKDNGSKLVSTYGVSNGTVNYLCKELSSIEVDINETSLSEVIRTGEPRIINDLDEYLKDRPIKDYNRVIIDNGIKASIALPLIINNTPVGVMFFSSKQKNVYNNEHCRFLKAMSGSIAYCLEKNLLMDEILYSGTLALAKLAESRDYDTGNHLCRIAVYSGIISKLLYKDSEYSLLISPEFIEGIQKFSPLHDIGKVAIKDEILLKSERLSPLEYEIMKTHALFGSKVLESAGERLLIRGKKLFNMGIEITKGHHEKWDGTGYPSGLKGDEIPLSARIVAVADVFDALTSKRSYKEAFSVEKSFEIIKNESGKHFDPEIVRVFLENKDKIVKVYNEVNTENQIKKNDF